MPMGNWLPDAALPRDANGKPAATVPVDSAASAFTGALSRAEDDVLLAGCEEGPNHFSYDARMAGRPNGAFTYYALKALKTLPADATYAQWHAAVTPASLPSLKYPQSPQIVGSEAAKKRKVFA